METASRGRDNDGGTDVGVGGMGMAADDSMEERERGCTLHRPYTGSGVGLALFAAGEEPGALVLFEEGFGGVGAPGALVVGAHGDAVGAAGRGE